MPTAVEVPHLAGREAPLFDLGFSGYQAAWLALVCLHSGVFTRHQFCHHHSSLENAAHRFVRKLRSEGLARERPLPDTRHRYTHVFGRSLYRALAIEHIRHRRAPRTIELLFARLLSLDYVVDHPEEPWLPTEAEKVAYFTGDNFPREGLPSRTYSGAVGRTRRYFAHKLPVAAAEHAATFVYADGGRASDKELRTWAVEHTPLWTHLRQNGTSVHVAAIVRTRTAQQRYDRLLKTWLSHRPATRDIPSSTAAAPTPEDQRTLDAIDAARRSGRPDAFDPWGGFAQARRIALSLRNPARTRNPHGPYRIDTYSTHFSHRLAPDTAL